MNGPVVADGGDLMSFARIVVVTASDGVLKDMSLASRTISIVLGLGLVDKVLEFTKDTYTYECPTECCLIS